jgi:hypothetical protein
MLLLGRVGMLVLVGWWVGGEAKKHEKNSASADGGPRSAKLRSILSPFQAILSTLSFVLILIYHPGGQGSNFLTPNLIFLVI